MPDTLSRPDVFSVFGLPCHAVTWLLVLWLPFLGFSSGDRVRAGLLGGIPAGQAGSPVASSNGCWILQIYVLLLLFTRYVPNKIPLFLYVPSTSLNIWVRYLCTLCQVRCARGPDGRGGRSGNGVEGLGRIHFFNCSSGSEYGHVAMLPSSLLLPTRHDLFHVHSGSRLIVSHGHVWCLCWSMVYGHGDEGTGNAEDTGVFVVMIAAVVVRAGEEEGYEWLGCWAGEGRVARD